MTPLHPSWQPSRSGHRPALRRPGRSWAQAMLQQPTWVGAALVTLCALALLLAFRQVVMSGVQQGELRHRAAAAHADGVWRCNALRVVSQRASCRAQLDATAISADHAVATTITVANVAR